MKTLFETDKVRLYSNPSDEVFVHNKYTGVTLRIGVNRNNTRLTADSARWSPTSVNGLPAFTLTKE
jgi:hypothetical protein